MLKEQNTKSVILLHYNPTDACSFSSEE